jgi:pimeloyl-ACP methyl ester carboxylesterase
VGVQKLVGFSAAALLASHTPFAVASSDGDPPRYPAVPATTITWGVCSESIVGADALSLGDRLRCGQMEAPLDHHRPMAGRFTIALVQVKARDPAARRGTLFVNPGGPGETPMTFVPRMARLMNEVEATDSVHGKRKLLSDEFDLVGVVPRGLPGGTTFQCASADNDIAYNDPLADTGAANVQAIDRAARAFATACRNHPFYPYISTEQTVYDLDLARRSLGEPKLNYYGIAYGAWLGAWYGATYPEHVDRMLLDSSMDWTTTMEANLLAMPPARQDDFHRLVVAPAVAAPSMYGLGCEADAIVNLVTQLAPRVRAVWANNYRSPESLLAAVAASNWLRTTPSITTEEMRSRIATHIFTTELETNDLARLEASRMLPRLFTPAPTVRPLRASPSESVHQAVVCNNTETARDGAFWQAKIAEYATRYPGSSGEALFYPCAYWARPNVRRPSLSRLNGAGKILMLHSEFNAISPLSGAMRALTTTTNARMLLVRDTGKHGVFGNTNSACVELAAGRFLLDGTLPANQLTECRTVRPSLPSEFIRDHPME